MCTLTVASLMSKSVPISLLLLPMESAPKTSVSRLVRSGATTRFANLAPTSGGIHDRPQDTA